MENFELVSDVNKANLITHNGKFHIDEVFSTVLLMKVFKNIKLIRLSEIPKDVDCKNKIIYDIGGGRFDHHQINADIRENGIKYSSFGLLWKEYGRIYLKKVHCEDIEFAWKKFDQSFVQTIDKIDNFQIEKDCLNNYLISNIIESFNPTWNSNIDPDLKFKEAANFAVIIFDNIIKEIFSIIEANTYLNYMKLKNSEYIILEKYVPYNDFIIENDNEKRIKFIVYPSKRNGYEVRTVLDRAKFPDEWYNLSKKEFYDKYKIDGMLYCHSNGKLCIVSNIETAIDIINLTLLKKKW